MPTKRTTWKSRDDIVINHWHMPFPNITTVSTAGSTNTDSDAHSYTREYVNKCIYCTQYNNADIHYYNNMYFWRYAHFWELLDFGGGVLYRWYVFVHHSYSLLPWNWVKINSRCVVKVFCFPSVYNIIHLILYVYGVEIHNTHYICYRKHL